MSYDPNSIDAMFARILQRMDTQDEILGRIESQTTRTNGRVSKLEQWRTDIRARVAVISAGISGAIGLAGWLLSRL